MSSREIMVLPVSRYTESLSYLQEEAGALRHKSESYHRRDARQRTHHHKHSPAVELVGRTHAETPACTKKHRKTHMQSEIMWYSIRPEFNPVHMKRNKT